MAQRAWSWQTAGMTPPAMKASLQLRLSQHLALTPQLQQSIRLLQLSTLELQQEVAMAVAQNPLLENEDEWIAVSAACRCGRIADRADASRAEHRSLRPTAAVRRAIVPSATSRPARTNTTVMPPATATTARSGTSTNTAARGASDDDDLPPLQVQEAATRATTCPRSCASRRPAARPRARDVPDRIARRRRLPDRHAR